MELDQQQPYWAVVDGVASPAHHVQDVVRPIHLTVNAVKDGVVCSGHNRTSESIRLYFILFMFRGHRATRSKGHVVTNLSPWLSFVGNRQAVVRGNG